MQNSLYCWINTVFSYLHLSIASATLGTYRNQTLNTVWVCLVSRVSCAHRSENCELSYTRCA